MDPLAILTWLKMLLAITAKGVFEIEFQKQTRINTP